MASPDERSFATFPRGHVRDNIILSHFRSELRTTLNPATGVVFTEDEIQRATGPGTRFYLEADALDLLGMAHQQRAIHFAGQLDPRKANTQFLTEVHGRQWLGPDSRLPATGASGPVRATGVEGTTIIGSETLGDPAAAVATDPNGQRFQNITSARVGADNTALLLMRALDGGDATRLKAGTELRWSTNYPPTLDPTASVISAFDGGFAQETDQAYGDRVVERIRSRPASGNSAHFQAWAREASSGVEQAFVYPCALNAGTVLVALTEKREVASAGAPSEGPRARIPSSATLLDVANFIVPPASPVVPQGVLVIVTGVKAQPSDLVTRLSLSPGRSGGWADVVPWPAYSSNYPAPRITSVSSDGEIITITTDVPLPNDAEILAGPDAPKLMVWNANTSRFVKLDVYAVFDPAPGSTGPRGLIVTLASEPTIIGTNGQPRPTPALQTGMRVSPYTDRADIIGEALESYFDGLGPGEVVPATDVRYPRAKRYPARTYPSRAGQGLVTVLVEALGGTAADAELTSISRTEPDLPQSAVDGPNMVTLGHLNVAPL